MRSTTRGTPLIEAQVIRILLSHLVQLKIRAWSFSSDKPTTSGVQPTPLGVEVEQEVMLRASQGRNWSPSEVPW